MYDARKRRVVPSTQGILSSMDETFGGLYMVRIRVGRYFNNTIVLQFLSMLWNQRLKRYNN